MEAIKTLDTNASLFFDHRDPTMVKWLGERKLNGVVSLCSYYGKT